MLSETLKVRGAMGRTFMPMAMPISRWISTIVSAMKPCRPRVAVRRQARRRGGGTEREWDSGTVGTV